MRTLIATLTLVLSAAGAAEARGINGGEIRIGAVSTLYQSTSTSFDGSDDDTDVDILGIGSGMIGFVGGFAISPNIEVGALLSYQDVEVDEDEEDAYVRLGGYFNYNFPVGASSAYGEAMLLYESPDDDFSQTGISIGGGFKAFVADGGSLDVGLKAFWLTGEIEGPLGDVDVDTTGFLFHLGVSVWIGGGGTPQ